MVVVSDVVLERIVCVVVGNKRGREHRPLPQTADASGGVWY